MRQGFIVVGQLAALAVAVLLAVATGADSTWDPVALVGLLLVLTVGSDVMTVTIRGLNISGAFIALVLAMALLGPLPAATIGCVAALIDSILRRCTWDRLANNVITYATFSTTGAALIHLGARAFAPASQDALAFAGV